MNITLNSYYDLPDLGSKRPSLTGPLQILVEYFGLRLRDRFKRINACKLQAVTKEATGDSSEMWSFSQRLNLEGMDERSKEKLRAQQSGRWKEIRTLHLPQLQTCADY